MTSTPTRRLVPVETLERLQDAVWQALDDMGPDGHCVCGQTKHELQCAYLGEPFSENEVGKYVGREIHVNENEEALHELAASPASGKVTEAEVQKAFIRFHDAQHTDGLGEYAAFRAALAPLGLEVEG